MTRETCPLLDSFVSCLSPQWERVSNVSNWEKTEEKQPPGEKFGSLTKEESDVLGSLEYYSAAFQGLQNQPIIQINYAAL